MSGVIFASSHEKVQTLFHEHHKCVQDSQGNKLEIKSTYDLTASVQALIQAGWNVVGATEGEFQDLIFAYPPKH
jgi:hypothetical protein